MEPENIVLPFTFYATQIYRDTHVTLLTTIENGTINTACSVTAAILYVCVTNTPVTIKWQY